MDIKKILKKILEIDDLVFQKHNHLNKLILDKITQPLLDTWSDKYTKNEVDNKINQVVSNMDWKESVGTFNDLAATYPHAEDGWTVNTKDKDITYRYDGSTWIPISANSIPLATSLVDGKMSKQDKIEHDDMNSKKHTHANKTVIDNITQALLDTWNAAYSHIGDAVRHITSAERSLWNTVGNKLDKSGGNVKGKLLISEIDTFKEQPPRITLALGDNDTGFNSVIDGITEYWSNNVKRYNMNDVYHTGNKPSKSDVGLGNADNTSDLNKPISTAVQTALNNKSNNGHTHDYLPLTGGILTGTGTLLTFDTERAWSFMQGGTGAGTSLDLVSSTGDKAFRVLNSSKTYGLSVMTSDVNPTYVTIDNNKVYHAGSKPTPAEIGASANGHTHDDRYYTESESDAKYATKDQISKAGYGDMLKSVYDKNGDGIVDSANKANITHRLYRHDNENEDKYYISPWWTGNTNGWRIGAYNTNSDEQANIHKVSVDKADYADSCSDSDRVDGKHASDFATNNHDLMSFVSGELEKNFSWYNKGVSYHNHYSGHSRGSYRSVFTAKDNNTGLQISANWCIDKGSSPNDIAFRVKRDCGDDWSAWASIYTSNNKPTPADIGASPNSHNHDSNYVKKGPLTWGNLKGV